MTNSAQEALAILRDASQFQWYIIPLLLVVIYAYTKEVNQKKWNVVLGGLALWGMDWFNEIWNALVFHFTNYAPVWGAPGKTAFLLLIGLNIEISFMFLLMGLSATLSLPEDKKMKIFGVNNRIVLAVLFSIFSVIVEIFLHLAGALTWDYSWWSVSAPWLIFLVGYLPFFVVAFWVHDMESRKKQLITVGSIYAFNIVCLIVFGGILGWI